jgi:hypothetical protein
VTVVGADLRVRPSSPVGQNVRQIDQVRGVLLIRGGHIGPPLHLEQGQLDSDENRNLEC